MNCHGELLSRVGGVGGGGGGGGCRRPGWVQSQLGEYAATGLLRTFTVHIELCGLNEWRLKTLLVRSNADLIRLIVLFPPLKYLLVFHPCVQIGREKIGYPPVLTVIELYLICSGVDNAL